MTTAVRIEGLDKLMGKLERLKDLQPVKTALKAAAEHVKGKIAQYPPATSANSPAQRRWYERGYGPRWRRADGSIGGRKTSETLGKKWTTRATSGGLGQIVGNNVSYGPFVQGDQQASFHKQRGWKTTEQVAKEEANRVIEFVQKEVQKALER